MKLGFFSPPRSAAILGNGGALLLLAPERRRRHPSSAANSRSSAAAAATALSPPPAPPRTPATFTPACLPTPSPPAGSIPVHCRLPLLALPSSAARFGLWSSGVLYLGCESSICIDPRTPPSLIPAPRFPER